MAFPSIGAVVAYRGAPYRVWAYLEVADRLHAELMRCPGNLAEPESGWHEDWTPPDPVLVPIEDFLLAFLQTQGNNRRN